MKLRSMEEKISYRLFLMGFLGLIFTAALCIFVFHKAFTAQAWSALERETDLVRAGYEQTGDPTQLSAFVTDDLRVTLISQDGSVLFESATDQPMENHLTRPEIRDAIANGEGRDIRDSQTMGYETYYYALRLSGGDVLRVAQDAETVWSIYDATIPAIVLVVGLGPIYRWLSADVLSTNPIWLCFAYVVLVMPFAFRALAVGLNSIDVKTLCEASRSLGASWPRVFFRVLIPNLWQSILSASFISIAVVLGEYTVASLLGRMNLQVALYQLGQSNSQISTAMSLLALLFGVILLVALDLISGAMRQNKEGDNS